MLLRDSMLDAMREVLLSRDWSAITLSDVARTAGISQQTIYNEFGSRQGLAQGYAMRLADRLVDAVAGAITGERRRHLRGVPRGFPGLLHRVRSRPAGHLAADRRHQARPAAAHHHRQRPDHHPLLGAADVDRSCTAGCAPARRRLGVLARAIVRLAMSYVSMPPEADHDVARDLARLMTPFAERYGVIESE